MLLEQFQCGKGKIGVIGMGYVGLPLALAFVEKGFKVVGFDVDSSKVTKLNAGVTYIHHIPSERIANAIAVSLEATAELERLAEMDAIILCVPTPLGGHREPDLTFIVQTTEQIAKTLRKGQLVVLESTTFPGTTREIMIPILEKSGLVPGKDFYVAYSPEREDPSNPSYNTTSIPKVVGGYSERCGRIAMALYEKVISRVILVETCEVAEASKILENTFRAVNIALVNELKMVFHRMGIDIWNVIDAAETKPFGFMRFNPGPGLGGHCIPIDPFYLTWKAHEFDVPTRFIEMAGEINTQMPYWVCRRTLETLSMRGTAIRGAKLLILGLAYKKNVDDDRESPSYKLMSIFSDYGAHVDYHDPYVKVIRTTRHFPKFAGRLSVSLDDIDEYDAVVISTDHDVFDWSDIQSKAKLIIDTRGVYRKPAPNVVSA